MSSRHCLLLTPALSGCGDVVTVAKPAKVGHGNAHGRRRFFGGGINAGGAFDALGG